MLDLRAFARAQAPIRVGHSSAQRAPSCFAFSLSPQSVQDALAAAAVMPTGAICAAQALLQQWAFEFALAEAAPSPNT
eukprot:6863345-Alexandrium_andersonii.AAC.1